MCSRTRGIHTSMLQNPSSKLARVWFCHQSSNSPSPSLNIGQSMLGMLGPNVQLEMGWLKLESNVNEISNLIYGIGWSYTPWGLSHQSWALDVVASNNQEKYLSDCKVAVNQDKQLLLSRQ